MDHCRSYPLSDLKEPSFQATCDHNHSDVRECCAILASTLNDIEEGLFAQSQNMTSNTKEELVFRVKNAKTAILAWKSHLLRSVNQDGARVQLLEAIDESSVLVVQDWAMKYLPWKYRESQADRFGNRGIPSHLTVAQDEREGSCRCYRSPTFSVAKTAVPSLPSWLMLLGNSRSPCPGSRPSVIGRIMPAATTAETLSSVQHSLVMKKVSRSGVYIFLIHKGARQHVIRRLQL